MSQPNSQEQTIYRSLAGQIQLGFYDAGERFPSVQEIAGHFQVSCCPAQRALKALERDGLIRLCRGKPTIVLAKPYESFLESPVFLRRAPALGDLVESLGLISSSVCFEGLCLLADSGLPDPPNEKTGHPGKRLYRLFDQALQALGSQTARSLYYDIGSFAQSAFLDILYAKAGGGEAGAYLNGLSDSLLQSLTDCRTGRRPAAKDRLERMERGFYERLGQYFSGQAPEAADQEPFRWEPYKGRTRYCDIIAIDLLRKIDQGVYPVGSPLPGGAVLADTYHVSPMTIRRTIGLLGKLGITRTRNGVGTGVVCAVDSSTPYKIKNLMIDHNFRICLEALQLLAITCEPVIPYTFSHCPPKALEALEEALQIEAPHASMVAVIGACLQAVACHCPLAAIREIYGKLTLSLLGGSVLQFGESGREPAADWPDISSELSGGLKTGDPQRFAAAFRRMLTDSFHSVQRKLIQIGVAGAQEIRAPLPSSQGPAPRHK